MAERWRAVRITATVGDYNYHSVVLALQYKRTLEASCRTSQPVISEEDINSIFSNLQQLQNIHKEFVEGLHNKVNNWSPEQTIGDVFKCLVCAWVGYNNNNNNDDDDDDDNNNVQLSCAHRRPERSHDTC